MAVTERAAAEKRGCGSCAHWGPDASRAGCGWCRARPPAVGADGKTRFPRTRAGVDWCAEWAPGRRDG